MQNELYHAWFKKGEQKENHKYIRREWKNGRWYYYYDSDTSAKPKNTKVTFSKSNAWGDSRFTIDTGKIKLVNIEKGKLSRAKTAAKKKVYDTRDSNTVDGNNILNRKRTIKVGGQVLSETKVRGKLERSVVAGKEFVSYLLNEE